MIDTVAQDSIKLAGKILEKQLSDNYTINWWMWIAIFEFCIIIIFILRKRIKPKETGKRHFKNESLKQEIDFNNIINSSFNSIMLYDELKVKCHPDRFPNDPEKNAIAELIFQEITKNRNNAKRLIELKEEAINKLNINF
jgi:hypothetical protein